MILFPIHILLPIGLSSPISDLRDIFWVNQSQPFGRHSIFLLLDVLHQMPSQPLNIPKYAQTPCGMEHLRYYICITQSKQPLLPLHPLTQHSIRFVFKERILRRSVEDVIYLKPWGRSLPETSQMVLQAMKEWFFQAMRGLFFWSDASVLWSSDVRTVCESDNARQLQSWSPGYPLSSSHTHHDLSCRLGWGSFEIHQLPIPNPSLFLFWRE